MVGVPVVGPLPDIADHVEQAVAVRREGTHRRGALKAIQAAVVVGELPLKGVGHRPAAGVELLAPGELRILEAAAGGPLPLRFAGEGLAGPGGVGQGILVRHMNHGMMVTPLDRAAGPSGWRQFAPCTYCHQR
jgi:hypothetical protein